MKPSVLFLALACFLSLSTLNAQNPIPNPGFETWSNGEPSGWMTDNLPGSATPVTQSSDAHSGSSALQAAVVSAGISYPPVVNSGTDGVGFPISARYASLTGYYKYSPVGGDSLVVIVVVSKHQMGIGGGTFVTAAAQSAYTQFTAAIKYGSSDVPDTALIEISIIAASGQTEHIGSTLKIDDLSFGSAVNVDELTQAPRVFALSQNYPNPFNPATTIRFEIPRRSRVRLTILNALGQKVAELADEEVGAGIFERTWNAHVASGLYFYRLEAVSVADPNMRFADVKKMIFLK